MATPPASDNTFLRLDHLDIHADDSGSPGAVAGKERERDQRAVGGDRSGRGLRQFSTEVCKIIAKSAPEESMATAFTRNRLPPNLASWDTSRIPKLQELSFGLVNHQVEAAIPSIKQEANPQSSSAKADISITTQATVHSHADASNTTTTQAKEETSSTEDFDFDDDTTRIPKLQELSFGLVNHQVEADIPSIKQEANPQSSSAKADISITTQATVHSHTDTSNTTTTQAKEETSSTEDFDFDDDDLQTLNVSTMSQLMCLPPKLHSLTIRGCQPLEVPPGDLLDGVHALQHLNLVNCSSLRCFPYPASLTKLYLCKCGRLEFLPSLESRKKLAFLHSLFIGNSCDSLTTLSLNLFPKLKVLRIWDCPNLLSFNVTGEVTGDLALECIDIKNCPGLKSFPDEGLHTPNLTSILLSNCNNLNKLPNWMSSLTSLDALCLRGCPLIESFHSGSLPSSLTLLSIAYCDKLTPQKDWGLENLESLTNFVLEGGCIGMESFPEEKLLPRNIISMRISNLNCLRKLDYKGFEHLNALRSLEINCCGMLRYLPKQGLPSSLDYLCIKECPMLGYLPDELPSSLNYLCIRECPMLTPTLKPMMGKYWHTKFPIRHIEIDH